MWTMYFNLTAKKLQNDTDLDKVDEKCIFRDHNSSYLYYSGELEML